MDAYQQAINCAKSLHYCNKVRLGIEYEQAKFFNDIVGDCPKAASIAERAVTQAIDSLHEVDDDA